jgi:hypothetical protein
MVVRKTRGLLRVFQFLAVAAKRAAGTDRSPTGVGCSRNKQERLLILLQAKAGPAPLSRQMIVRVISVGLLVPLTFLAPAPGLIPAVALDLIIVPESGEFLL